MHHPERLEPGRGATRRSLAKFSLEMRGFRGGPSARRFRLSRPDDLGAGGLSQDRLSKRSLTRSLVVSPSNHERHRASSTDLTTKRAATDRGPAYLLLRSSFRIASSASITSSRDARLLAKLNLRLNAFVVGR